MDIKTSLYDALEENRRIRAVRDAFATVKERQKENKARISDLEERKERLRKTREKCIGNGELLNLAIENLKNNGFRVYFAKTKEEALSYILKEIGDERLVVKAKSNLAREINLTEELDSRGIEVIETDIGDRILQLTNERPSHPTGPVSHLTTQDISKSLSGYFKREVSSDPQELVKLIREDILGYMEAAKIGITGVNAIAAEEGAILLLHNEGNILDVMLRPKHIIVAGIDKIYPNLDEALNMAKLQTFYATGELITSFINIVGGPSKTMDIEKKLLKGIHGPEEICLILLDNHRSEIIQSEFKELLYCIGCGACLLHCPVYNFVGNKFGNENSLGGRDIAYSSLSGNSEIDALYSCITCEKCKENCPVSIDVPSFIKELRKENAFIESHLRLLNSIVRFEILALVSKALKFYQRMR